MTTQEHDLALFDFTAMMTDHVGRFTVGFVGIGGQQYPKPDRCSHQQAYVHDAFPVTRTPGGLRVLCNLKAP
jgi:hypothetical protein